MQDQQQSPIETPTTPSTPNLPPFPLITSFIQRRPSVTLDSAPPQSMRARRRSSAISIPSSPLDTTITRPLPIRPHRIKKTARVRSPSPTTNRPRSRSVLRKYHLRVNTAFTQAIVHLETPLVPLISVTSGLPHPSFPTSILQYHLLTHETLDELARFYHQVYPPVPETYRYPARIPAWVAAEAGRESVLLEKIDLETKRRRWGRFVGLRGCETPVEGREDRQAMEERMDREWRRALEKVRDEERLREKGWRGRW